MDNKDMYKRIYEDVFCNTYSQSYYVFLCGSANGKSIRNAVRKILESKGFQVLYPEDLFLDVLNKNKSKNLFEYEKLLSNNSDIVCVICESIGSAVELGIFTESDSVQPKLVVAIEQKYARDKSFIMLGPIKFLKQKNKDSVIIYKKSDLQGFCNELEKAFNKIKHKQNKLLNLKSFSNLASYISLIQIILYFYRCDKRMNLYKNIKDILKEKLIIPNEYNDLFNAAIKYLLKSKIIIANYSLNTGEEKIFLSKKGIAETKSILTNNIKKGKFILQDKLRCDIILSQLNN